MLPLAAVLLPIVDEPGKLDDDDDDDDEAAVAANLGMAKLIASRCC